MTLEDDLGVDNTLVGSDGRWRQLDARGHSLWPRTYHDDHGVTHAVLLSFDNGLTRPILVCTKHVAHSHGVDERNEPLTCLTCLVKCPQIRYDREEEDVDET